MTETNETSIEELLTTSDANHSTVAAEETPEEISIERPRLAGVKSVVKKELSKSKQEALKKAQEGRRIRAKKRKEEKEEQLRMELNKKAKKTKKKIAYISESESESEGESESESESEAEPILPPAPRPAAKHRREPRRTEPLSPRLTVKPQRIRTASQAPQAEPPQAETPNLNWNSFRWG